MKPGKKMNESEDKSKQPIHNTPTPGQVIISPAQEIIESTHRAAKEPLPPTPLPLRTVRCPKCEYIFEHNCEGLRKNIDCPECKTSFPYFDGYLCYYKEYIEIFIDQVHAIPLVPGYSTSGRVMSLPDDLLVVDFGIKYRRPPEVFFLVPGNKSARQWITNNQLLMPLSVGEDNFILFSRSIARSMPGKTVPVTWMAIGEKDEWEKPLWLNYLKNAAELVRQEEDIAAIVMLMIALDFFYDHMLGRIGIDYAVIRREGRRPQMNEKKAKLKMIADKISPWPESYKNGLSDLTDYRNLIVHGVVKRDNVPTYTGKRAFQIVLRAVLFLIESYHRNFEPEVDKEG
jgi:hypothetical protein